MLDAAEALRDTSRPPMARLAAALSGEVAAVLDRHPLRELLATGPAVPLRVDRQRALFGSWYRLFPRSEGAVIDPAGRREPQSGGLRAAAERLPAIAAMGFDVVHLPPVHPIGHRGRRGPDGSPAGPGDPGSPWAVGSADGGHDALHPELGTLADFDHFTAVAAEAGLEVALELSLRCSPDHPWVDRHPGWFERTHGDETAESLLPRYEHDPAGLTREVLRIVRQWARHGVRIFRVAEPGAWPLEFWQEVLAACHRTDPELLFVAGPGVHPALRRALARVGFHLCALGPEEWTDRRLLRSRLTELAASGHLRPQLDAAPAAGGRTAFEVRTVLAALLAPTWGVPAGYELCEEAADEEYRYLPRPWAAVDDKSGIAALLTRLNRLRRRHPALQQLRGLRFHPGPAEDVLVFSKWVGLGRADVPLLHWQPDRRLTDDLVITMVNLTGEQPVEAVLPVGPADFGLPRGEDLYLHDELTGAAHPWRPGTAFTLDPATAPACVLTVRRL